MTCSNMTTLEQRLFSQPEYAPSETMVSASFEAVVSNRFLVNDANRAQNRANLTEVPIRQFTERDTKILQDFDFIWQTCFGKDGYMRRKYSTERLQEAQKKMLTGFILGFYAHQDQNRKSGEPYYSHCTTGAKRAAQMRLPIEAVVAMFLHDAPEDTTRVKENKPPYPFPVSLDVIRELVGKPVRNYVDGLTEVSGTQKRRRTVSDEGLVATRKKLLQSPMIILLKIVSDRLHNMETINGLSPTRQHDYAEDTRFHIGLGRRYGIPETNQLADMCYAVLYPKITDEVRVVREKTIDRITPMEVEAQTFAILQTSYEEKQRPNISIPQRDIHVALPGNAEIIREMGDKETVGREDLFYWVNIVVDDTDKDTFDMIANETFRTLGKSDEFKVPENTNVGMTSAILRYNKEERIPYYEHLLIDQMGNRITLKIHQRSDYERATTSLAYLFAEDLLPEDEARYRDDPDFFKRRQQYAEERWYQVAAELEQKLADFGDDDEAFTDSLVDLLPHEIEVTEVVKISKRRSEDKARPIHQDATVLDYVMKYHPDRWQEFYGSIHRDDDIVQTQLGKHIQHRDLIQCIFTNGKNRVQVSWLDAVQVNKDETQQRIAQALVDKINSVPEADKIKLHKDARIRGERILREVIGLVSEKFSYSDAARFFPDNDPGEFLVRVGLSLASMDEIERVKEKLLQFWENLTVIAIHVGSHPGMLSIPTEVFKLFKLNIIHNTVVANQAEGQMLLEFRFDSSDPHFSHLKNKAIPRVIERFSRITKIGKSAARNAIKQFANNTSYEVWRGITPEPEPSVLDLRKYRFP